MYYTSINFFEGWLQARLKDKMDHFLSFFVYQKKIKWTLNKRQIKTHFFVQFSFLKKYSNLSLKT